MMRLVVVTAYHAARSVVGRHKSFALLAWIGLQKCRTLHLIDEELLYGRLRRLHRHL
jgi:hypothetical protein